MEHKKTVCFQRSANQYSSAEQTAENAVSLVRCAVDFDLTRLCPEN